MDIEKAIRELYDEKRRIDEAIAMLERRPAASGRSRSKPRARRGRKSMSESERRKVSERMIQYWARRRAAGAAGGEDVTPAEAADPTPAGS